MKSISDYESTDSVNPLYFIVGEVNWYIGEKMQIKYLVFDYTCEEKKVLERYTKLWDGIKNEVETIN